MNLNHRSPIQEHRWPKPPNQPLQAKGMCTSILNKNQIIQNNQPGSADEICYSHRPWQNLHVISNLSKQWRRTTGLVSLCISGFTQLLIIQLSEDPICNHNRNAIKHHSVSTQWRLIILKTQGNNVTRSNKKWIRKIIMYSSNRISHCHVSKLNPTLVQCFQLPFFLSNFIQPTASYDRSDTSISQKMNYHQAMTSI